MPLGLEFRHNLAVRCVSLLRRLLLRSCPAAKRSKQRKGPKAVRVDVEEDLMDDMGGTPTPMNAANRAHQAYAAAGRDKRKRKVGRIWLERCHAITPRIPDTCCSFLRQGVSDAALGQACPNCVDVQSCVLWQVGHEPGTH